MANLYTTALGSETSKGEYKASLQAIEEEAASAKYAKASGDLEAGRWSEKTSSALQAVELANTLSSGLETRKETTDLTSDAELALANLQESDNKLELVDQKWHEKATDILLQRDTRQWTYGDKTFDSSDIKAFGKVGKGQKLLEGLDMDKIPESIKKNYGLNNLNNKPKQDSASLLLESPKEPVPKKPSLAEEVELTPRSDGDLTISDMKNIKRSGNTTAEKRNKATVEANKKIKNKIEKVDLTNKTEKETGFGENDPIEEIDLTMLTEDETGFGENKNMLTQVYSQDSSSLYQPVF